MKRLSVLLILVLGAMLLAACIGTGQATINPNPTAVPVVTNTGVVSNGSSTGAGSETLAPGLVSTSVGGEFSSTAVTSPQAGLSGTGVPNTGLSSVFGTQAPFGSGVEGTTMPTYSPDDLATMAAFQTPAGVPNTGATANSQEGTSYPWGYGPTDIATGMAFLPPSSATGTPVPAQQVTAVPATGGLIGTQIPSTGATAQTNQFVRLQSLLNFSLQDATGMNLGTVSDFVINLEASRVDYVVVNVNGRQVLVPWTTVGSINTSGQAFAFNADTALLQGAPTFNTGNVNFNQNGWDADVQNYWYSSGANAANGTSVPSATGNPSGSFSGSTTGGSNGGALAMLFSQLANVPVAASLTNGTPSTQSGANSVVLGTVRDAVVDRFSGALPYLLISANTNFLGLNNRLIPVPFYAFQRSFNGSTMYFTIDINALRNAPSFDAGNLPNVLGQGWDSTILNYWTGGLFSSGTVVPQSTP